MTVSNAVNRLVLKLFGAGLAVGHEIRHSVQCRVGRVGGCSARASQVRDRSPTRADCGWSGLLWKLSWSRHNVWCKSNLLLL